MTRSYPSFSTVFGNPDDGGGPEILIFYHSTVTSGVPDYKRRARSRRSLGAVESACAASETMCLTSSGGFECIDTNVELTSW